MNTGWQLKWEIQKLFSEFENIMSEDLDDSSTWLAPLNTSVINKVFIKGFHTIYNIQVYNTQVQALFYTGASINAISFKFYSYIQQQIKLLPTNRKVVSADGDSLHSVGEVHLKFKVGKIDATTELAAHGIEGVSISSPLKINF